MVDRRAEAGQATTEYLGSLLASAVVVALVVALVALPQPRHQVVSAARAAACTISIGENCDEQQPGGQGAGEVTEVKAPEALPEQAPEEVAQDPGDWNCTGFWGCTWNGVKQAGSGVYNVGKGAVDDVVGVYELVKDPSVLVDAGQYIWDNPGDAAKELVWDQESSQMWDREDYGGAGGRTLWNVGSWFIPGVGFARGASKAGKLGKLGKAADAAAALSRVGKLADETAELARRAKVAAGAGNFDEAQRLAREARAKADEAAREARSKGCTLPVAGSGPERTPAGTVLATGRGGAGARFGAGVPLDRPVLLAQGCETDDIGDAARAEADADAAELAAEPPPRNPAGTVNKGALKNVDPDRLELQFGDDAAHMIKYDVLGPRAKVSRYDLKRDPSTGQLYLVPKSGGKIIEAEGWIMTNG